MEIKPRRISDRGGIIIMPLKVNVYYVCIKKRIKVKGEHYGKFRVRNC